VNLCTTGLNIATDLRSAILSNRRFRRSLQEELMENILRNFLADQLFGLDGLINLANIALLLAFSVRDVLKLRILALASDVMTVPYYYFQDKPLWPPIFWSVAFIIVNGVWIVTLTLERRPVVLSDRETELHRVAFGSVDKRVFLKLVSLVRWVDLSPGELIVEKGQQISNAIVLISGEIEAVLSGRTIFAYRPGQLIGNVSAYSGLVSPMDVMARGPARLAMWEMEHIREFTDDRPELRARFLQIVNADLAAKLHSSISNQSHN
jgi:Popeye protein conserved region